MADELDLTVEIHGTTTPQPIPALPIVRTLEPITDVATLEPVPYWR
jgi:hypothetical protein